MNIFKNVIGGKKKEEKNKELDQDSGKSKKNKISLNPFNIIKTKNQAEDFGQRSKGTTLTAQKDFEKISQQNTQDDPFSKRQQEYLNERLNNKDNQLPEQRYRKTKGDFDDDFDFVDVTDELPSEALSNADYKTKLRQIRLQEQKSQKQPEEIKVVTNSENYFDQQMVNNRQSLARKHQIEKSESILPEEKKQNIASFFQDLQSHMEINQEQIEKNNLVEEEQDFGARRSLAFNEDLSVSLKPDPIKIAFKNDIADQNTEQQEQKEPEKINEPLIEKSEFGFDEDDEINDKVEELKVTKNRTQFDTKPRVKTSSLAQASQFSEQPRKQNQTLSPGDSNQFQYRERHQSIVNSFLEQQINTKRQAIIKPNQEQVLKQQEEQKFQTQKNLKEMEIYYKVLENDDIDVKSQIDLSFEANYNENQDKGPDQDTKLVDQFYSQMNIAVGEDEKLPEFIKNEQNLEEDELEEIEEEKEESDDESQFDALLNPMNSGKPQDDHLSKLHRASIFAKKEDQNVINTRQSVIQKLKETDKMALVRHKTFLETIKEEGSDFTRESIDMIRFIDWNERRHRVDAQNYLKKQSQIVRQNLNHRDKNIHQHRLSTEVFCEQISNRLQRERGQYNCTPTCLALSDDLIIIGNSMGELWMYDRSTQEAYDCFTEKSKEFSGNAVTAIEVHPSRSEYVLIGYFFGQIILIDVTQPGKSIKIIKDNHRNVQVVNLAFCDWEKPKDIKSEIKTDLSSGLAAQFINLAQQKAEDKFGNPIQGSETNQRQSSLFSQTRASARTSMMGDLNTWMFVSVDSAGRVVLSCMTKGSIRGYNVAKQILIEPLKGEPKFFSLSTRFRSELHPQPKFNDCVTLVACANSERTLVFAVNQVKSQIIKVFKRPNYISQQGDQTRELNGCLPQMTWGYGQSPLFKDRIYATLAIGWGPLIQLFVLNDVTDKDSTFFEDGFIVLQPDLKSQTSKRKQVGSLTDGSINPYEQTNRFEALQASQQKLHAIRGNQISPFELPELFVEKIYYLCDSCIIVLTRSLELRILYTKKFEIGLFAKENSLFNIANSGENSKNQISLNFNSFKNSNLSQTQDYEDTSVFSRRENQQQQLMPYQIDNSLYVSSIVQSLAGSVYSQTFKSFGGMVVALSVKGVLQFYHLNWMESLQIYSELVKGDWFQQFARALDIYTGKVKGFKDVPEEQYMRQETMKAELKILIREIIITQLDQWAEKKNNQSTTASTFTNSKPQITQNFDEDDEDEEDFNPYGPPKEKKIKNTEKKVLDTTDAEILQNLNNGQVSFSEQELSEQYRMLMQIVIEFCVTIQDCYFLFYDLFLLFQEEQLEKVFLDELKPFMMAGRFQDWELPGDILENHIINYYKDPKNPELLEKIIINLNLKDCTKDVLQDLLKFCEKNYLTSGLLYLYTAIDEITDKGQCMPVIQSLLSLYKNAINTNPGSHKEIKKIIDLSPDSIERLKAEKSALYQGYKLLWVIRLLINGKRFPQGIIETKRWNLYVIELANRLSNEDIMVELLKIDSEAFFQILSIYFYKGQVFNFINDAYNNQLQILQKQAAAVKNSVISLDLYQERLSQQGFISQSQLLDRFDKVCLSKVGNTNKYKLDEQIRYQYLFFVANVPAKNNIQKDPLYFFSVMKLLLQSHQQLMDFNKNLIRRANQKGKQSQREQMQITFTLEEEQKSQFLSENCLLDLLDLCGELSKQENDKLLNLAEQTPFNYLKVSLLEKQSELVQCLKLFIDGSKFRTYVTDSDSSIKVFKFITEKLDLFDAKRSRLDQFTSGAEDEFRNEIKSHFKELIRIDPFRTFELIEYYFDHQHLKLLQTIVQHPAEQFSYLDKLLIQNHDNIQGLIERSLMSALESIEDKQKATEYMEMQKIHFKLLCQIKPKAVLERVRQVKRNEVKLPPFDCLEICEQFGVIEGCAILANKMGFYLPSVTHYMSLVTKSTNFSYPLLIKQIRQAKQFQLNYQKENIQSNNDEFQQKQDKGQRDGIPHFIPFLQKQETQRNKLIMIASEYGLSYANNRAIKINKNLGQKALTKEDLFMSQLIRFDYILRKVMKICAKESKDFQNSASASAEEKSKEDVYKVWFYILEQMFKIKSKQISILQRLRNSQDDSSSKWQTYDQDIRNFEKYFQSRLHFVIETSLNHLELEKFLGHIVQHDSGLQFIELREMIHSIFTEVSTEQVVLMNAQESAKKQINQIFEDIRDENQTGIIFNERQCPKCNKFIDDDVKEKLKNQEVMRLMSNKRKGTLILGRGHDDSDDDGYSTFDGEDPSENVRLYDCGHAFHVQCISNYIIEKDQGNHTQNVYQQNQKKNSTVPITRKQLNEQKCPWCFSDRFHIDFAQIFQRTEKTVNFGNRMKEIKKYQEEEDDFGLQDQSIYVNKTQLLKMKKQRQLSGSIVMKHQKSKQEELLNTFDLAVVAETIQLHNFRVLNQY